MTLYRFATAGTAQPSLRGLDAAAPVRLPRLLTPWLRALAGLRQRWQDAAAVAQVDAHVLRDIGVATDRAIDGERLYRRIRMAASGLSMADLPAE